MFPPIVAVPRLTVNDEFVLGSIPKDTSLHYDIVNLQRNPQNWGSDIDVFNPSRFDGRNTQQSETAEKDTSVPEKIRMPARASLYRFSRGVGRV
jgi:hypothetical protein